MYRWRAFFEVIRILFTDRDFLRYAFMPIVVIFGLAAVLLFILIVGESSIITRLLS